MENNWWIDNQFFVNKDNKLLINNYSVEELVSKHGTPLYVYNMDKIIHNYRRINEAMKKYCPDHMKVSIHYAMKANGSREVLKRLLQEGCCIGSASVGEFTRAIECGYKPENIIFTAPAFGLNNYQVVAEKGVLMNVDSFSQIKRLAKFGPLDIAIRHNPGINGVGFNKKYKMSGEDIKAIRLGIYTDDIIDAFEMARELGLNPVCLHQHVGSNWTDDSQIPLFQKSIESALEKIQELEKRGFKIKTLNIGGGPGVKSHSDYAPFPLEEFSKAVWDVVSRYETNITELALEPGRFIVDDAGILLAQVDVVEQKKGINLVGINAGFNLIHHMFIYNIQKEICNTGNLESDETETYSIGGYLGEQSDIFFEERELPIIKEEEIVALFPAGGYCASELAFHHLLQHPKEAIIEGDQLKVNEIEYKQVLQSKHEEITNY